MQPPGGQHTELSVDRQRTSQSFFGAFSLIGKRVTLYPIEGNRNTWQTILAPDLLQRETGTGKTTAVPDNARPHHARALTGLHEPGRLLERITPIHLPPYAPDHNPVEHVRNTAKSKIANIQRETPEETLGAFASYIASRTFDHDFEHLPTPRNQKRFCFMTAIILPHDHFTHCPKNTKHSTQNPRLDSQAIGLLAQGQGHDLDEPGRPFHEHRRRRGPFLDL